MDFLEILFWLIVRFAALFVGYAVFTSPFLIYRKIKPDDDVKSGETFRRWLDFCEASEDAECDKFRIGEDFFDANAFKEYGIKELRPKNTFKLRLERYQTKKQHYRYNSDFAKQILAVYDTVIAERTQS